MNSATNSTMAQRIVITGAGLVSCLGNTLADVSHALKTGQSGIVANPTYQQLGFKSCVSGSIAHETLNTSHIDRKLKRFLSNAALYAYLSALDAISHANLSLDDIKHNPRIGVVAGSGGASTADVVMAADKLRNKGLKAVGAMSVPKTMSSTVAASLATGLQTHGVSYSISSACATSAHCIGHAAELIQLGKQDIVLAGGGEEEHWTQSCLFDAMGAMSSQYNDTPALASRPFDTNRDGFVIAGGGGMVVVESLTHAQQRGAPILAEIIGYGATSDGAHMVAPSGDGAKRCMQQALAQAGLTEVDYINAHGTATGLGDVTELAAIGEVFTKHLPAISSTKSMTGHSLGAAGAQELIYCLLMMQNGFIAPSINITELDKQATDVDIVQQSRNTTLNTVMSNSFGFGGTNASVILKRWG